MQTWRVDLDMGWDGTGWDSAHDELMIREGKHSGHSVFKPKGP